MNNMETSLTDLKEQIDRLKIAVDKCFVPSIYVHTFKIGSIVGSTNTTNLTDGQKDVLYSLDSEALRQFERLSKGRCSCKVSDDI